MNKNTKHKITTLKQMTIDVIVLRISDYLYFYFHVTERCQMITAKSVSGL